MLRPIVRSLSRSAVIQCRCRFLNRRIHATSIRSIDDPDKPNRPAEPEPSTSETPASINEDISPTTPKPEQTPEAVEDSLLTSRIQRTIKADQNLPARKVEAESLVEQEQRITPEPVPSTTKTLLGWDAALFEAEFEKRSRERRVRIEKDEKDLNFPTDSIEERSRKYRQNLHDDRMKVNDDAAIRGELVFDMLNKARAERGEPPIGRHLDGYKERVKEERAAARAERLKYATREPANREFNGSEDRYRRGDRNRSGDRGGDRGRGGRGSDRGRGDRGGRGRGDRGRRGDRDDRRGLARREPEKEEEQIVPSHVYSSTFDPSNSVMQALDEADIELGYDLPELEFVKKRDTVLKRDGTFDEHRRTNLDFDEPLPDDAGSYIDITELGPVGTTLYSPPEPLIEEEEALAQRIEEEFEEKEYNEAAETDVEELFQIKQEIEEGQSLEERREARVEREIEKAEKAQHDKFAEGRNIGTWNQFVPLPKAHLPETANLDDYVPPVFTHESFRYGVPAIPVGVQGRLRAAHAVSYDSNVSPFPTELNESYDAQFLPKTEQEAKDFETSEEGIIKLLESVELPQVEQRPLPQHIRISNKPEVRRPRGWRGPGWNSSSIREIEDIYDDTQLAIWKEMHKGSFAPTNVKFPMYENEDEDVTTVQEEEEGEQRIKINLVMGQLDAATLKTARRRDEFEIRDIRRRLGLPIVNDTFMEDAYASTTRSESMFLTEFTNLVLSDPQPQEIEGGSNVLKAEIDVEKPVQDDTQARLQFWRDSKAYLTTLSARINQLRTITLETSDRMRRHGTAELHERLKPNESPTTETVDETPEAGIMAKLHEQFLNVHKKLEQLEILVTGVQLGPRGPLDPKYSEAWVEHHLHEDEKKEFEQTAVKMGYPPNSVSMEPQVTEEQRQGWETLEKMWLHNLARIGVGGEYHDSGITPMKEWAYPLDRASEYVSKSGMNEIEKAYKISALERTYKKMGLLKEEEVEEEEVEEEEVEEEEVEEEEEVKDEVTEGESTAEAEKAASEELEEAGEEEYAILAPVNTEPGERISSDYVRVITEIRRSMVEIDKEVSSLEESYDALLERQPPIPPTQPPTPEAST